MLSTIFALFVNKITTFVMQTFSSLLFVAQKCKNIKDKSIYSVIARNADIDVTQWIVRVDESNDRYVDVRRFRDSLVISHWVSDDNQTRLFEGALNLIGKWTWRETTGNRRSSYSKRKSIEKLHVTLSWKFLKKKL